MPPKRVPNMAYRDVVHHVARFGEPPAPNYPTYDNAINDFSLALPGFLHSPGLVALKVWIDETVKKVQECADKIQATPSPHLDLNAPLSWSQVEDWKKYNDLMHHYYNTMDALCSDLATAEEVYFDQRELEWDAHLKVIK